MSNSGGFTSRQRVYYGPFSMERRFNALTAGWTERMYSYSYKFDERNVCILMKFES